MLCELQKRLSHELLRIELLNVAHHLFPLLAVRAIGNKALVPAQLELLEPVQVPSCLAEGQLFQCFECIDDPMECLGFLNEWQDFDQLKPLLLGLLPELRLEAAPVLDDVGDEAAAEEHLRQARLLLPYLHLLC